MDLADINVKVAIAFSLMLIAGLLTYLVVTRDSKHK